MENWMLQEQAITRHLDNLLSLPIVTTLEVIGIRAEHLGGYLGGQRVEEALAPFWAGNERIP